MHKKQDLTLNRAFHALGIGALVGALILTVWFLILVYLVDNGEYYKNSALSKALILFILSFLVWYVSLIIFGGPIWYLLHKKQKTHWVYATLSGAIIPFLVIFGLQTGCFTGKTGGNLSSQASGKQLWIDGVLTSSGWMEAFSSALFYSAVGTCISIVMWYVAYGTKNKSTVKKA